MNGDKSRLPSLLLPGKLNQGARNHARSLAPIPSWYYNAATCGVLGEYPESGIKAKKKGYLWMTLLEMMASYSIYRLSLASPPHLQSPSLSLAELHRLQPAVCCGGLPIARQYGHI
jgi:hypothetical protein